MFSQPGSSSPSAQIPATAHDTEKAWVHPDDPSRVDPVRESQTINRTSGLDTETAPPFRTTLDPISRNFAIEMPGHWIGKYSVEATLTEAYGGCYQSRMQVALTLLFQTC